jgi:hypothetical protein
VLSSADLSGRRARDNVCEPPDPWSASTESPRGPNPTMATHSTPAACGSAAQQESTALMIRGTGQGPQPLIEHPWPPGVSWRRFPYRRAPPKDRSARPPRRSTTARRWPSDVSVALPLPGRHRADCQSRPSSQRTSCSPCTQAPTAHPDRKVTTTNSTDDILMSRVARTGGPTSVRSPRPR